MELAIVIFSFGVLFGIAYVLIRLAARVVDIPPALRPALAWALVQAYLVAGLFISGDLPGAPRALWRISLTALGLSVILGLINTLLARRNQPARRVAAWGAAGLLPWLLALGLEGLL